MTPRAGSSARRMSARHRCVAAGGADSQRRVTSPPLRIMPLGDSNTDGFAVPGGYRIDLEDDLSAAGYTVEFVGSLSNGPTDLADRDHEGHVGFTIEAIRDGFGAWYAASPADVILLMAGTNDVKLGATTLRDAIGCSLICPARSSALGAFTAQPDRESEDGRSTERHVGR